MSRSRFTRALGVNGRAAVTLQWLLRMVAGLVALGVVRFVATISRVTILSPSQFLDRFLALNHTMPSFGPGSSSIFNGSSPLQSIDLAATLLVWCLQFFVIFCPIFAMWYSVGYGSARYQSRSAASDHEGDS